MQMTTMQLPDTNEGAELLEKKKKAGSLKKMGVQLGGGACLAFLRLRVQPPALEEKES